MGTSLAFLHCLNGLECVDRICPCKKVLAALPNQLTLMPILVFAPTIRGKGVTIHSKLKAKCTNNFIASQKMC